MKSSPVQRIDQNIFKFQLHRFYFIVRTCSHNVGRGIFHNSVRTTVFAWRNAIQQFGTFVFNAEIIGIENVEVMSARQSDKPLPPGGFLLR